MAYKHITVLKKTLIDNLNIQEGDTVVDCTFGGGGHAQEALKQLNNTGELVVFDLDTEALENATDPIYKSTKTKITEINDNFKNIAEHITTANVIYADFGFSSDQLNKELSFKKNGPLDMRFDKSLTLTAKDIVNGMYEKELANILKKYSDENLSKQIAREIVQVRKIRPIETKEQLRELLENLVKKLNIEEKSRNFSPAARVFQALRIAVNDELNVIDQMLQKGFLLLAEGGRIGVISFHSGEDRVVKKFMKGQVKNGLARWVVEIGRPTPEEVRSNRKAHSAILRIIEKL